MPRDDDPELMRAIGARLAGLRQARGLTQAVLAESLGVATETVSRYEQGSLRLTVSRAVQLAERLGTTVSRLLEEPNPSSGVDDPELGRILVGWSKLGPGHRQVVASLVDQLVKLEPQSKAKEGA